MENTKNEKKEALISALKYTYVGLLNTVTFAYITQYNIYIAIFLLLLTIFISSSVYHGQLKIFRINKKIQKLEEESGIEHKQSEDKELYTDNWMVVVCTLFCVLAIIITMVFRT